MSILSIVGIALATYAFVLFTWLFYLAIMHLKVVRHDLYWFATVNAYVLLVVGLVMDVILNVVVGSALFAERPREWLLTARLKRHKYYGSRNSWRYKLAMWICEHFLEQFDEGHCG